MRHLGLLSVLAGGCSGVGLTPPASEPVPPPGGSEPSTEAWVDGDGDGHGDPAGPQLVGTIGPGFASAPDDCDDTDPEAWTGAVEVACDDVDNDCDGVHALCSRSLVEATALIEGDEPGDTLGTGFGFVGDVDGDGVDDVVVTEADGVANTGKGHLVSGARLLTGGGKVGGLASTTLTAPLESGWETVLHAGDVDGDGAADFWMGGPLRLVTGAHRGGTVDLSGATTVIDIGTGVTVARSAEVTGDGRADVVLTADMGYTLVFDAPFVPGTRSREDARLEVLLGCSKAGTPETGDAGDLDGDGVVEILLGAGSTNRYCKTDPGVAAVDGNLTGTYNLSDDKDLAAFWVPQDAVVDTSAVAGDVNGDGYADLLMAMNLEWVVVPGPLHGEVDPIGEAMLRFSSLPNPFDTANAVFHVGSAGDVDGDGRSEVYGFQCGPDAREDGACDGAVFVVRGGRTGSLSHDEADAVWVGQANDKAFSTESVKSGGDVDQDGVPDFLVSARATDLDRPDPHGGHVYLLLGRDLL